VTEKEWTREGEREREREMWGADARGTHTTIHVQRESDDGGVPAAGRCSGRRVGGRRVGGRC
jgi:hypothetical protein